MRRLLAVPGYDNVFAGDDGSIWVQTRHGLRQRKLTLHSSGYLIVRIGCERRTSPLAHALVCAAFHGPRPPGMTVAHLNGRKTDNRPENLAWATMKEQTEHKRQHGTMPCGDKSHMSKVSDADWLFIIGEVQNGASKASLARRFGVSPQAVGHVIAGRARRHLSSPEYRRTFNA